MKCSLCGGLVTWRGPLSNLTHTQCESCGRQNCQEVEPIADDEDEPDWEHPCPFRGEPTMTPAGEACSACGLRERDINDAAAGVAEVGPADPWRPIDTAPKNGREVILREGDRVGAACWIKWPDTYDSDGAPNADGGEGWTIGWDGDEWREPDAWQPLPPAHGVTASPADLLKVAQAMQEELGLGSSRPMSLDDALDRAAGVPDLARGVTDALPFDREYVSGYLSEVLAEATGNADPEVQKLLAWLADGVLEAQGNRCGCNHWTTPKCPERTCPWQGKRPVDAGVTACPAGWQLVPVKPTEEMARAGVDAYNAHTSAMFDRVWEAMLAAAPAPRGVLGTQGDQHG